MANRATLEMQARVLGLDPDTIPNDSVLTERILYLQRNAGAVTGALATGTLTSTGTAPANNDTVTIGSITYTFKTALSSSTAAYEVLIGASASVALDNLKAAINNSGGTPGTTYGSGTIAHPQVTAGTKTATTLAVDARYKAIGNTIATTETSTQLSWGGATLASGLPGIVAAKPASVAAVTGGSPV